MISEVLPTVEEEKNIEITNRGRTVNASQNLVCSLYRQHIWCSYIKHNVKDAVEKGRRRTGLQDESELWSLCWQHGCRRPAFTATYQYRLKHAVTLVYDSWQIVFTSDPAIMKRKRRGDVDDVAVKHPWCGLWSHDLDCHSRLVRNMLNANR